MKQTDLSEFHSSKLSQKESAAAQGRSFHQDSQWTPRRSSGPGSHASEWFPVRQQVCLSQWSIKVPRQWSHPAAQWLLMQNPSGRVLWLKYDQQNQSGSKLKTLFLKRYRWLNFRCLYGGFETESVIHLQRLVWSGLLDHFIPAEGFLSVDRL